MECFRRAGAVVLKGIGWTMLLRRPGWITPPDQPTTLPAFVFKTAAPPGAVGTGVVIGCRYRRNGLALGCVYVLRGVSDH